MEEKQCAGCGKTFYPIHGKGQIYCTPNCRAEHRKQIRPYDHTKRPYFKKYMRRRSAKARAKLLKILGETCVICGGIPVNKKRSNLCFHNIHFRNHRLDPSYVLKHIEEFVSTCSKCHNGVHFLHDVFGMSWEDILAFRDQRKTEQLKC